jgi:hypothetical protein
MPKLLWGAVALVLIVVGIMAWARSVNIPPDRHRLAGPIPEVGDHPEQGGFGAVRLADDPLSALTRLEAAILASPRTERLAGRAANGEASFVTRSAFWGFPDVTNIRSGEDRIEIRGHLVLGRGDLGVNRRRIGEWLHQTGLADAS